ncbi:hypothetical protein TNCT_259301 [Trichonephila clavata]|uniref:Major facilitator superfamily associated domain-containing protein n=1 Tax=Trichonephila clavata TaxID=2740835 RepID=A0A8X6HNR3_TRICU|nr:hypothetical protein TNCT_259301 [Trichonephila clavata]
MGALQVNKGLLPIKAHYFLLNGAHAGVVPFITVYAKQMGISADAIGIILAILCCFTVLSRPLLGSLVDRLQQMKTVLMILVLIDIAVDMGLNSIPSPTRNCVPTSLLCLQNTTYLIQYRKEYENNFYSSGEDCVLSCKPCLFNGTFCNKENISYVEHLGNRNGTKYSSNISPRCWEEAMRVCPDENATDCSRWFEGSNNTPENPFLQLSLLSIFTALLYICMGSIVSLSDAACFNALGAHPELYGRQRMWGTIGWGCFALVAGFLNQVFTHESGKYNFSPGFYMLAVLFVIDLMVISKLKLEDVKESKNIFKDVGQLVVKPRITLFILQVYFVGIFIGIGRSYVFWYLRTLNASQLVLGCTSAIQCFLGELPFFFFAGWIITKIGHVNTFTMSFVAHGFKFLCYSFLVNPWWGLPIEFLQGPCFGSFYTAMASYAKTIAPEGTEATVQGLASGTFEGLGVATGSLLGGYGFRAFGGRTTFFWTGIISFCFGTINFIISYITSSSRKN